MVGSLSKLSGRSRQAFAALTVCFRNPKLRLVAIARVASVTGRWASTIALAVFAYKAGGATSVGVLGVVRILPAAFAGPLAAGLLDRVGADRLLLVAGVFRTLAIGAAGFAVAGGAGTLPVFVLVAIESLLSTMVRPLQTSALPFFARTPGELTAANLSLTTIESVGMLLGPAVAGLMLTTWSPGAVLLVTAAAYAISTDPDRGDPRLALAGRGRSKREHRVGRLCRRAGDPGVTRSCASSSASTAPRTS